MHRMETSIISCTDLVQVKSFQKLGQGVSDNDDDDDDDDNHDDN